MHHEKTKELRNKGGKELYFIDENGLMQGLYKSWHPNGNPYVKANYKNGKLEGEYSIQDEDGMIIITGKFKNGECEERVNIYRLFNGLLQKKVNYKNEKEVSSQWLLCGYSFQVIIALMVTILFGAYLINNFYLYL